MPKAKNNSAHSVYLTLWKHSSKTVLFVVLAVLALTTSVTGLVFITRGRASAATASTINFQARLLNAAGNVVDDGTYNIQFNLYTVSSGGSTEWTETYLNNASQGVQVKNGFLSVSLGTLTGFPITINWDQEHWLGMTVRGTGSCVFGSCTPADSEMTPRFKLTAVPYAFQAGTALGVASNNTSTASTNSGNVSIVSGNASGATSNSGNITIDTGTATGTTGALLLGTANASALTIGRAGITTALQGSISLTGAGTALSVTNDASIGGTLSVTSTSTFTGTLTANGGITVANGKTFTNAGSTLNTSVAISNLATGGAIGTAAATVDGATTFDINQTTAAQTLTLPTPTTATSGRIVYVNNVGSASFTMYGAVIAAGKSNAFIWNGTAWVTSVSLSGTVVNTVGTLDSQTKSADGAVIASNAIYLQTADASFPGVVSTGTQTFAGDKTFNNSVTVSGGATVTGPAAGSGTAVTINTGNATNAGLVINGAASQTAGFIAVTGNGAGYSSFVVDSLGRTSLRPLSSTGDAFKITDNTGATALLGVDTTSGLTTLQGLNVVNAATVGTLTFQGSVYSNFTTPQSSTVTAKLTVPLFNPGPSNQVVALGLPNGAATSSRGISLFDNRAAGDNQPVLSVFTPNESDVFGLSSDGSNSYGYLKSTSGIGLGVKVGANVVAQFDTSNNTTLLGNLTLQGGSATLGTTSQAGSLLLSDGSSNTATINVGALAGNYSVSIPTITANDTFCLQSNNCGYVTSSLTDNITNALNIHEGSNNYINVNTTNGSENISFGNATTNPSYNFLGSGTLTVAGTLSPTSGVLFPGDNFLQTKSSNTLNDTTGILIPLYIYPGFVYTNSDYNNIIALKKKYHDVPVTVILNPATGPGSSVDTNYQDAILRLHGAGIKILGYVNTNSAGYTLSAVETDIDGWKTLYPNIDGIFMDLMTYDANSSHYTYYSNLTAYAHGKGFYPVVGNPGTAAPQGYFDNPTADIITVYENSSYPTEATLQGDWAGGNSDYNTNRRAVMVYNQASFDYTNLAMMKKYAGYVYVTSGSGANPWATIPSYLENIFQVFNVDQDLILNTANVKSNLTVGTTTSDAQLVVQNSTSGVNPLHIIATQDQDTGTQVGSTTDLVVNPSADTGSASFIGNEVYSNIYPGATIANDAVTNFNSSGVYQSSGNLNLLVGYASSFGYWCSPSCGTVGGVFGYVSQDPLSGGGTMPGITNNVGVSVEDRSRGTNQVNVLIGAAGNAYSIVPSGSYSIYNASTKDNVFAGNLRVGSTTAPTVALDVTGAAKVSSTLAVTGTSTFTGLLTTNGGVTSAGDLTVTNAGNVAFQKGSDYTTSTTPQNDVSFGTGVLFRLNPANAITITGIAGGTNGRMMTLANVSAFTITINDNDSGSTATNRIITGTGSAASLLAGGSITLIYDSGSGFWRITGAPASVSSSAVTLQTAYNNSTSPEITVNGTNGALTIRDNSTPIGANLLEVQNNAGTTSYLAVAAAGVSVNNTPFSVSNGSSTFTSNATTGIGQTITSTGLTTGLALRVDATSTPTTGGASGGVDLRLTNAATTTATTYTGWNLKFTNNPTVAGNTEYAAQIQNQAVANTTDNVVDALLRLDNADTSSTGSTTISSALLIQNSGGIANGIATAININTADVVTDLSLQNGETIDNNTDGTIKLTSSVAQLATANASGTPSTNGTLGLRVDTATFTDNATAASGIAAAFAANSLAAPTLAASNASVTTTNAATLYIQGAPIKGSNNTAASSTGLYVAAGAVGAQTASYGAIVNAQTGATNNYAAAFLGGNVGVGTSAPSALLSVKGTTIDSAASGLLVTNSNSNTLGLIRNDGYITLGVDASTSSTTIGYTTVGASTDVSDSGSMNASKFTTSGALTIVSMSVYVGAIDSAPNNKYQVAIYTDNAGNPNSLVASSAQGTLNANSWNTISISASLSAATTYWLAYNTNGTSSGVNDMKYDSAAANTTAFKTQAFGSFPASFGATGGTSATVFSIYASSSSTAPAFVINQTGKVGIGNASPNSTLDVAGTTALSSVTAATALTVTQSGAATAASIVQSALGNGLNITSSNSSQTTQSGLNVVQSGVTTGFTGNFVNFTGSSTTGSGNLLNLTSVNTTAGNALNITANSLSTGNALNINSTGTLTTTGSLATLTANNATTATGVLTVSATGLTTGSALNVIANSTANAIKATGNFMFAQGANRTLSVETNSSNSTGYSLTVQAGASGNASNTGGDLLLKGGATTATGAGGAVTITSGAGGATSGNSGAVSLKSGDVTSGTAGNVTVDTGTTTAGTPTINIGNANAKAIQIGNNTSNPSITIDSGTSAISIGTGAQNRTTNIATGGAVQSVTLGSTNTTSTTTLQAGSGFLNFNATQAQFSEVTGTRTLTVQTRTTNVAGSGLTVAAGAGGTGGSAVAGGLLTLQGGAAAGTGNANGGAVALMGGLGVGTGIQGNIILGNGDGATPSALTVRGAAGSGTNIAGGDITFDASNGTGNSGSGAFVFRTASGASASSVTKDNEKDAETGAATTLQIPSFAIANQSNRILIVSIATQKGTSPASTVSGVTFNTTTVLSRLTSQVGPSSTGYVNNEIWYAIAPPVLTGNIDITVSASSSIAAGAISYYNVAQTNTFPVYSSNQGSTANPSITLSGTTPFETILNTLANETNPTSIGAGMTSQWSRTGFGSGGYGETIVGGYGATTTSWTSNAQNWAQIAVAINSVGGSGSDTLSEALRISPSGNIGLQGSTTAAYNLSFGAIAGATTAKTIGVDTQPTVDTGGNGLTVSSGAGNGIGAGGALTVQPGRGGTTGTGGQLNLTGGQGGTTNAAGGVVAIQGGAANATTTGGAGGAVTIQGGTAAGSNANNGGAITVTGGTPSATGAGGAVTLTSGAGGATSGASGAVSIKSGTTTSGASGAVTLQSGNATGGTAGTVTIDTGTGGTSTINIGNANAGTIQIGNNTSNPGVTIDSGTGAISIGTGAQNRTTNIATGGAVQTVTIGSTNTTSATTIAAGSGAITFNASQAQFSEVTGTRTLTVQTRTSNVAGSALTVSAGAAGTGASAFSGGTLTLQGGAAAGTGNANGGGVTITGGAGTGTGVLGLVSLAPTYFVSSGATQSFSGSGSLTGIDSYSTIVATSTGTGVVITVPAPASGNQTVGRVLYVAAANGSNDFTLSLTGTSVTISMKANSTATLIWNGTGWTAAGASSSTDLQAAYNNTLSSAGGAEIVLNNNTSSNGLTIRNNATSPLLGGGTNGGALLETQTSIGSNLFSVNNNATEYATNGGAETAGASSTAFPASSPTWKTAPNGGTTATISRETSIIATGQASTKVVTNGTTANQGADNELSVSSGGSTTATALTANLQYTVSFAVKGATNFSTLDVVYSKDGTNTSTTSCSTGNTVEQSVWSRITCTFTAPSSGITSSNAIFVRQSDTTVRTWYVDNLSVTVNASVNHAADGSADVSGSMGATNTFNWVAVGGSVAQSTGTIYDTSGSVAVTTSATNQGVYNNLLNSITPTVSTSYRASFYLKANSGTVTINSTTPSIYYSRDGGTTKASCNDLSATSITTTASWTLVSCIFTTDSTPAGTLATNGPRFYITNTSNTTFFIDALTITLNQNTANNVQIGGSNNGGPVTLFTLDRSAGAPIAANNDAYLGSMYYDTSSSSIQCYGASGWGACGAAPDNIVNLTPEFPGAVLNGTGVGTMTADFCANQTGVLTVNSSLCDGTGTPAVVGGNFYKWTSPQASQQTYSIYVSYQLPTTFKSFSSDNTVQLTARVDDTTNAAVTYQMYDSHSGTLAQCGTGETTVTSSNNTWQTVGINGNEATGCSLSTSNAGDTIIFKINVKAANNKNAYVAGLSFTTKGK